MALRVPFDGLELAADLLGLFVVNSDGVILACSAEGVSVERIVKRKDVVALLMRVEDLLSSFSCVLVEMAVGIGYEQNCGIAYVGLINRPPAESIDWSRLFPTGADLRYFIICS